MPEKKVTDKQKEEAWKMYKSGRKIADIAEAFGISYSFTWTITEGRERGFKSRNEYDNFLAVQKGHESFGKYKEYLAKQKGYESRNEYEEHLVKKQGFKSRGEYQKHLDRRRSKRKANRELSCLIKKKLEEMGRNQSWLAGEIGVSNQTVTNYIHGRLIPKGERAERLFKVLGASPEVLEDILGDRN